MWADVTSAEPGIPGAPEEDNGTQSMSYNATSGEVTMFSIADTNRSPRKHAEDNNVNFTPPRSISTGSISTVKTQYKISEAVEHIGLGRFQVFVCIICGLFTFSDAMEMLLLAVLGPVLRCEWILSEVQVAFITTTVFIGYFVLAPVWGIVGDMYGRKPVLVAVCLWIFFYGFLTAFSPTYSWVVGLRGLVGAGIAGAAQAFVLTSEYMTMKYRAKLLVLSQLFWTFGSLFEIGMAAAIVPVYGWRVLVAISSLPIALVIITFHWLPESARFLMAAGKHGEALHLINKAAKMNNQPPLVGNLVADTEPGDHATLGGRGRLSDLFSDRKRIHTTLGCWCLWFNAAFVYYGAILISGVIDRIKNENCHGFISMTSHISGEHEICSCAPPDSTVYRTMIASTLGEIPGVLLNLATLDLIGRKRSLALYLVGMGFCFFCLIACIPRMWTTAFIFMIRCLSTALFNAVYVYVCEVYPTKVRALALGSSSAAARIGAILTPFVAQVLIENNKAAAFALYGVISWLCAIICMTFPIETRGRDLTQ